MGPADPEEDSKKITSLLQNGAHVILAQQEAKEKEGAAFAEEVRWYVGGQRQSHGSEWIILVRFGCRKSTCGHTFIQLLL